jgi:hypothetical protein
MFGDRIGVEIGELTQRHTVGDPFAQFAIIPVLDAHQHQRVQHLRRRHSAPPFVRVLQTAHEIAPHPLDHAMLAVKELRDGCGHRLHAHALPHQPTCAKVICRAVARDTAHLLLRFDVFARARFNALT